MKKITALISAVLLLAALGLTWLAWSRFSQLDGTLPAGSTAAGMDVSGLTVEAALARAEAVYLTPITLYYDDAEMQVPAESLGLRVNHADLNQSTGVNSFWNYLWNQFSEPAHLELNAQVDDEVLKIFLRNEVAARYDFPAVSGGLDPASGLFTPGQPGRELQIEESATAVRAALLSPDQRSARLVVADIPAPKGDVSLLKQQLEQIIARSGFTGIAEIYLKDLQDDTSLHFALRGGQELPPDIAFTAASTMKVPIMVSTLRRTGEPTPEDIVTYFDRMIGLSENPPADSLMERIDPVIGPLQVTSDLHRLGLNNSFIAGFFYLGAPLLENFSTPANQRTDVNLEPDIYNQTTPGEMGRLMEMIYRCAEGQPGEFEAAFPAEISAAECELMLAELRGNHTGALIEAGIPDGTPLAHKHGWIEETDGLLHTMSDMGIVSGPDGDYVLAIYLYDPLQLVFNPGNHLIAELSNSIYNYQNVSAPWPWIFGPADYHRQ